MDRSLPASHGRRSVRARLALVACLALGLAAPVRAASPDDPNIRAAVARAIGYLKARWNNLGEASSLAAYALVKGGEPASSQHVQEAIAIVRSRFVGSEYHHSGQHGNYVAATDVMLLEAVDPAQYREEIQAITDYLVANQFAGGYWEYPGGVDRQGDTSQLQYALLGLWSAYRAGIDVPTQAWDRAAQFLLRSQKDDGGFAYTPFYRQPESTHSMTTAGVGCLALIKLMVYPAEKQSVPETPPQLQRVPVEPDRRFGVLKRIDITGGAGEPETPSKSTAPYRPQVGTAALADSMQRGINWYVRRYRITDVGDRQMYFLYGLERMAALAELDTIEGRDWYTEGANFLLKSQEPDGKWKTADNSGEVAATSWGILFLMRATSKLLGRRLPPPEQFGGGLLKGGRGLPSDLSRGLVEGGPVAGPNADPIEKLLAQLERQDSPAIESIQTAIVESVQFGSREELVGQKERLIKLAGDPRAEVRRTALWALGRSDDLSLVRLMVRSLKDPDLAVRIEAHNALCALSRRPNGFDAVANDPLAGLPENASEQDREAAIEAWTKTVYERWHAWYLTVRPYDQRDDLQEPKAVQRIR